MIVFRSLFIISLVFFGAGHLRGQSPSLEELEQKASDLDQNAATPVPVESAAASPNSIEPKKSASPPPVYAEVPEIQESTLVPIDIRSRMQKVTEANLFAGAPPVPGTLRNMATGEAPEEYIVKEGDNLFDICDQLIDEPQYWPKLWSYNPGIANPHFVYPGMKLRFYPGDAESPPFLQVIDEEDVVPVDKGGMQEKELVKEDISGMLMRSEIPQNQEITDGEDVKMDAGLVDMFWDVGNPPVRDSIDLILPAFIFAEEVEELGRVTGGAAGSFLVDQGQDLILEIEDDLPVDKAYTIIRATGKIRERDSNDFVGYRYEFIAQINVHEVNKEEEIARGRVLFSRLGVQPGDLVIPFRSVKRQVPVRQAKAEAAAGQVIVGFTEPFMQIGGRGGFAFISQIQQPLQEGKVYQISQNIKVAAPSFLKDKLPDTQSTIATVYVMDINGSAAVAYILQDNLEIRLGDELSAVIMPSQSP